MTWLGSLPAWAIFPLFAAAMLLLTVAIDGILRRRLVPEKVRAKASPTAATTLQALATIYAVLVAFVIVDEYAQLRATQAQVATTAAQLGVIFENSRNLTSASGARVQAATLRYARFTVRQGLPELVRTSQPSPQSDAALEDIYKVVATIEPSAESDKIAYQEILTALATVSQTRTNLINSGKASIPASLFFILAVLAVAVVAVGTMMDTQHRRSHLLILAALALGLSMTLALVAALDYPFRGFIHIDTGPITQFINVRAAR
jgi:ABC-type xylose transport system permease subunit